MNQPELTLTEVEQAFSNWRFNRKGNEGIPNHLWEQVKALLATYPRGELMRRLKLTTLQFKEKGLIPAVQDNNTQLSHSFVQIPVTYAVDGQEHTNRLTIQRSDIEMCIDRPSNDQIKLIINALWG